ncbi:hypothetical protein COO16_23015, partial [Bacillus pseudomycoides]
PPGEGAPQGLRGWGVRLMGFGEEFPNPSILEGLPRRLAGSKGYLLTTTRGLHSEHVNSLSSRSLTGSVRYR